MNTQALILLIVFIPVLGSLILPLLGRLSPRLRNICSLIFVSASFVFSLMLIPHINAGEPATIRFNFLFGQELFHADKLAIFMALVSTLVGAIIVLYSFGYINPYKNQNEYYFMVVLFLGSMMGIVFSSNLIILFLFWEITAIACWRLIGFFRTPNDVVRADKAFLVTVFGALVMLLGFFVVYQQTGTFDLLAIKQHLLNGHISNLAIFLILFGILSKSATLPLHTWLPDAGVAPSPVTALLHAAVLVKIGVYVFARLFVMTIPIEVMWHEIVPWIAGISAIVAAGAALIDTDMKRIIAYSTISQIGYIFLGLAIGNPIGIAGGLLYILMHGLAKGGLFLCAGIVEQKTHVKDITKLGGLITVMPITAISFLFCALSVMGIPPFGGFFSKYMVITSAANAKDLFIALTFVVGAFLTIIYLFRLFNSIFMGDIKVKSEKEGTPGMVFSVAALAVLSLLAGVFINYSSDFVQSIVNEVSKVVLR
ncbi:MAG: NADH-quinone oxidoreductase subunit L [Armatimonadota bacterium]